MPVDVDSIKREFEKVKEAEIEAEEGNAASKAKKENPIKVEKSFAESLQGFKLSVDLDAGDGNSDNDGDGEGDGEGDDGDDHGEGDDGDDHGDDQEEKEDREDEKEEEEEEEDKDSRDDVKVDRRAMSPLKMVSNKILSRYVTQASGPDYEQEVQKRRRAKKKLDRKGKLFPEDGDITDADNGLGKRMGAAYDCRKRLRPSQPAACCFVCKNSCTGSFFRQSNNSQSRVIKSEK